MSAKGVITAVGTGATSIVVSNGTASASVTVIVKRTLPAPATAVAALTTAREVINDLSGGLSRPTAPTK